MKERLDVLLTERGFFDSREKAKAVIMAGEGFVNGQREDKAGSKFDSEAEIEVKGKVLKYVSRGGLKLEKAIKIWNLDFRNKIILDIGASTGGFTDCALQNGAVRVYSVDVGTNQLDWRLKNDERVVSIEETHIKDLTTDDMENNRADFIVIDVSFISLTKVIPYLEKFLSENGQVVMLIKPQFEVGKEKIGKNGIVIDEKYHDEAIKKIIVYEKSFSNELVGVEESPIKGTKGNKEFLILINFNKQNK